MHENILRFKPANSCLYLSFQQSMQLKHGKQKKKQGKKKLGFTETVVQTLTYAALSPAP